MNRQRKSKFLQTLLLLSFALIIGLGYHSWQLQQKVDAIESHSMSSWSLPWGSGADPFSAMRDLQQRMDAWLGSSGLNDPLFHAPSLSPGLLDDLSLSGVASPKMMIEESSKAYTITIEVPQGKEVEINTSLENNYLSVSGVVKNQDDGVLHGLLGHSTQIMRFTRQFPLADNIDERAMTIDHEEGQMILTIPKRS